MATSYKTLYNRVYSKIKDSTLAQMSEETADSIIASYLSPAVAAFECCDQDLSDRDDENEEFRFDLSETNLEILANFMVTEYLDSTYIRTSLMLRSYMSAADFHKYDNKDLLAHAAELRDMYRKENRRLMINASFRNRKAGGK